MFPINTVLCPTDFSEPSYVGLEAAAAFAAQFSAELRIVHVITPMQTLPASGSVNSPPAYNIDTYLQELEEYAQDTLKEIIRDRLPAGIKATGEVLHGAAADEIVAFAEANKIDMIVIATHGWTGWRRFIFGSVAEKVVRTAPCPVFVVHQPKCKK